MAVYANKPSRFLRRVYFSPGSPTETLCCAGFQVSAWRCDPLARHLIEWLPDYALTEEELAVHHGNAYDKLRQAAARVYRTDKAARRGEAGEIALHAVCRDFFDTIPISPRVFYLSSSNDVVKGFDLVHAFLGGERVEVWLGESKLYKNRSRAISDAINSIVTHIDGGFLENEKLLLGPQIPKSTPRYDELEYLFRSQTSLDELLRHSTFVIGILADSPAVAKEEAGEDGYDDAVRLELDEIVARLRSSRLCETLQINLIYIPLREKDRLVTSFDKHLKGLTK